MAALGRAVTEKEMREQAGTQAFGRSRGGGGDKAVNHDRHAPRRAAQAYAGHRRDLKAAEGGERRERIGKRGAMEFERARYHFELAAHPGVVEPRAAAGEMRGCK